MLYSQPPKGSYYSALFHLTDNLLANCQSSRLVTSTASKLHFRAHGFEFCHNLNNATFNLDTVLYNWKSSSPKRISELNPTVSEFASFIDTKAKDIISLIELRFPGDFEEEQTRRLACFIAAEGSNPLANLSDTRLINMIDRLAYFKEILPAIQSRSLPARIPSPQEVRNIKDRALYRHLKSDGSKRKYKLAYLLMIHGDITTMPDVRQLIEELDDGSAVFLIHVDKKSEDLKAAVIDMIASREKALKSQLKKTNGEINSWDPTDVPGNVFMTSKSYEISWGHGSLMWCQLNGFWELLDLAEWEYVINLSASDYPLRKSREIAHILSQPKYKGRNTWIPGTSTQPWRSDSFLFFTSNLPCSLNHSPAY
ncbi:hypothetical protein BCR33DRAFT_791425 [Rhizoclosmatium globosum]|uniref:protein xylosyltransferase n=1 Tax=Rhizoclosmatium globosum TaxID=329046 RepID=A0A1Y2BFQ7_9FUNG|nr:hypothetical protein BCR33DRAFT_791425 [Rhizoclosmatium globosum]|eukprot:ORY33632.1 hypothetical protein BCR33DRAFT_791425 [Rhizoclosmatium globosum]